MQDQSSGGLTGSRRGSTGTVYSRPLLNRGNNHHPIVKHSKRDQMFGAEEPLAALCPGSSDKHVQLTAVTFLCVRLCVCVCVRAPDCGWGRQTINRAINQDGRRVSSRTTLKAPLSLILSQVPQCDGPAALTVN